MGRGRKPELTDWFESAECNKIIELSKQGYSVGRISELTGIKKSRINYARRLKGFKSDRAFKTNGIHYGNSKLCALHKTTNNFEAYNKNKKQESESRLAFLLLEKGFFYIGGYDGRDSTIKIGCTVCGGTFTRCCDTRYIKRLNNLDCPLCREKALEPKRQAKRERHQKYIELQAKREQKRTQRLESIRENQEKTRVCKECGKEFTLKDYAALINIDTTFINESAYCSPECRKKAERKKRRKYNVTHGKHKLRAIKYGVEFDKSVNLDDMLIRFGTKCALCGGECDQNDYQIINGVYIYGDNYPSIDHIIPLCKKIKGHTWDNVQVAHRGCNTKKGANIVA